MKFLFIGGAADGQWLEVPEGRTVFTVAINPYPQPFTPTGLTGREEKLSMPEHRYELMELFSVRFFVFVPVITGPLTELFRRILRGYCPGVRMTGQLKDCRSDGDGMSISEVGSDTAPAWRILRDRRARVYNCPVTVVLNPTAEDFRD